MRNGGEKIWDEMNSWMTMKSGAEEENRGIFLIIIRFALSYYKIFHFLFFLSISYDDMILCSATDDDDGGKLYLQLACCSRFFPTYTIPSSLSNSRIFPSISSYIYRMHSDAVLYAANKHRTTPRHACHTMPHS